MPQVGGTGGAGEAGVKGNTGGDRDYDEPPPLPEKASHADYANVRGGPGAAKGGPGGAARGGAGGAGRSGAAAAASLPGPQSTRHAPSGLPASEPPAPSGEEPINPLLRRAATHRDRVCVGSLLPNPSSGFINQ